jgi:hypothetical protein
LQIDSKETVFEPRPGYLDVIGEIERLAERPGCDAAVQDLSILLLVLIAVTRNKQRVFLLHEFDLIR